MSDNTNSDKKIYILFGILLIFNIILFIRMYGYMSLGNPANAFGFTNGPFWAPYLEMFKLLSAALILIFVALKIKSLIWPGEDETSSKTRIWQIIAFSILGILASYIFLNINGVPGNVRGFIVMISALIAGPYVGIPVAIIAGGWRYFLGGPTALSCAVATIFAGLIGSLVYKWNGGKLLSIPKAAIFMFLFSGLDMLFISALAPNGTAIATALYGPMTFASVVGIILFTLLFNNNEKEADE